MAQAKRDQNYATTAMGVNDSDVTTPMLFLVDPTTGALLVDITVAAGNGPVVTEEVDQNRKPLAMGVNASDLTTPMPFLIHAATGTLEVDFF